MFRILACKQSLHFLYTMQIFEVLDGQITKNNFVNFLSSKSQQKIRDAFPFQPKLHSLQTFLQTNPVLNSF